MGITKIDWQCLRASRFIEKLCLAISILFLLFIGYTSLFPSPTPRELVDQQFRVMDDLVAAYKGNPQISDETVEDIREMTNDIFQNYAREDKVYLANESTDQLIPIFEERVVLLENFKKLFPESFYDYLPDKEYVEQELKVLRVLVERHQDYVVYKNYGPVFEKILLFLGYGGSLFLCCLLTGAYFERKFSHQTLMEILPVSKKDEMIAELRYTTVWFYLCPTLFLLVCAGLYAGIVAKTNLFVYPIYLLTEQGQVLLSMERLFLIFIFFPLVGCLFLYIVQEYVMRFVKDCTVSTFVLLFLTILSTLSHLFWQPFFYLFPLTTIQTNGNWWISVSVILFSALLLMVVRSIYEKQ